MVIGTYVSIINLNVNGLNASTKRYRLAEWIQNKTHIYAICKKPTSDLKTNIYGSSFCIHSANLCLLVEAFNPLTFKVIIDKHVPIAIFFIVWD